MADAVNHPTHYNTHPVCEAIDVCEWLSFNLGNAVKYLWRAGQKDDRNQDLQKALWYLRREQLAFTTLRVPSAVKQLMRIISENEEGDQLLRVVMQHLYLMADLDRSDTGEALTQVILIVKGVVH